LDGLVGGLRALKARVENAELGIEIGIILGDDVDRFIQRLFFALSLMQFAEHDLQAFLVELQTHAQIFIFPPGLCQQVLCHNFRFFLLFFLRLFISAEDADAEREQA